LNLKTYAQKKIISITLVETIVYLALFAIVFGVVVQFSFSVSEANTNALIDSEVEKSLLFIHSHFKTTLTNKIVLNETESIFESNNSKLVFTLNGNLITYDLVDGRIRITREGLSNFINNPFNNATSFNVERVFDKNMITTGLRISATLRSNSNPNISRKFTNLYLI